MHATQLLAASLKHYRRTHLSVGLGVAVATAVITGALIVGDSVRGSLRELVVEGLGDVDYALTAPHPVRASLAEQISAAPGAPDHLRHLAPALMLPAAGSLREGGKTRFARDLTVLGVPAGFANFQRSGPDDDGWSIADGAVWLTPDVATDLGASVGAEVVLRLPSPSAVPADSPLGDRSDTTQGLRLRVDRVLPESGLARFSLVPRQRAPRNVFVSLPTLQRAVDLPDQANLLLAASVISSPKAHAWLNNAVKLQPADLGLTVHQVQDGQAVQLESDQLVLPPAAVDAARRAWGEPNVQPVVTYLANTLSHGDHQVAYSTVTGVESTELLGPVLDPSGVPIAIGEDECVLNDWAAAALEAEVGDPIRFTYYQPESTHGQLIEAPPRSLTLKAILPLRDAGGRPTSVADPKLTPTLEGVTDADTINDWDLPFELVEPITQADEDYWDDHTTTPKAFVAPSLAKQLWQTRWGAVSLVRAPRDSIAGDPTQRLLDAIEPSDFGLVFQPVKQRGLKAASGTTPFDGLFFGFSMFLIASSVLLIALLFRLGVDQRRREVGLLLATGWRPAAVGRQLLWEGAVVADVGAAVGVLLGVGYAWLMLAGLRTVWVAAIAAPFLQLHVRWQSVLLGYGVGAVTGLAAIWWAVRGVKNQPPRRLLAGYAGGTGAGVRASRVSPTLAGAALLIAITLAVLGGAQQGEAQAGLFFGAGASVLAACVLWARSRWLRRRTSSAAPGRFGLSWLALRNVARNGGRSLLTIALVGAASFLILAISAFRLPPTEEGVGGYDLLATADQPLHYDLNTEDGRFEYGFGAAEDKQLQGWRFDALRVYQGEDASCLNLYQTRQPRVLGVPQGLRADFGWADCQASGPSCLDALSEDLGLDDDGRRITPVVLDFNTAMYSLKLYDGVGAQMTIQDAAGRPATLQVVGLLKNSMLQGDLIVGEAEFLRLFPDVSGYQMLLCRAVDGAAAAGPMAALLEDQLSDYGLDAQDTRRRLAGFLAVQNTYLSTFQTLGALGLLLGVVGVAVVQLRSVAQRRGELALLRASGFSTTRITTLVLRENLVLLGSGLAAGALAAMVALAPQTWQHDTRPPWIPAAGLVSLILLVGLVVGWIATRGMLRAPLIQSLRSE